MVKQIITAFFFLVISILLALNLMSCSDVPNGESLLDASEVVEEGSIDLTDPKLQSRDNSVTGQNEPEIDNHFF